MRQVQVRFRTGVLCTLGLLATNAWAQGDLSQMSYTGLVLNCSDPTDPSASGPCFSWGSRVITPWRAQGGSEPTWSPDGAQIAFTNGADIVVTNQGTYNQGTYQKNLTNTQNNTSPAWAPDGGQIAFVSTRDGSAEIYLMSPDGSDVVRLTYGVASMVGRPAWSPDSRRIAFTCVVDIENSDICVINRDGSGFARLTTNPATDEDPAWSPDGTRIVFSTTRFYGTSLALMTPDGSQVAQLGSGIPGRRAAWSPDGTRIAFSWIAPDSTPDVPKYGIYTVAPDGTSRSFLGGGANVGGGACADYCPILLDGGAADPAWMPRVPVAVISVTRCAQSTCSFDGSRSLGGYATISSYSWDFGDGQTATGTSTSHSYAAAGTYPVRLTVTNANLVSGSSVQSVSVSAPDLPPSVAIVSPAPGTVLFELATLGIVATASDPDGTISSVRFYIGDTAIGTAIAPPYVYSSGMILGRGTYALTAVATDNAGLSTTSASVTISVIPPPAPPAASFVSVCVGLVCTFDGSSSQGAMITYAWDFGDGTRATATPALVTHTYSRQGTYTVTLTVASAFGSSTRSQLVSVTRKPGGR